LSLAAFFTPQSVAIIGASTNTKKLGHAVLENLVHGGFLDDQRHVYPINPTAKEILGLKAYASVLDVAEPIDLAVIVIPYTIVPAALRTCGEKGIPAAIVISAGFREAGMEGLQRERELVEITHQYGIRLIGPNCLGVIDTISLLNASFSTGMPPSGPMAFMSQSGALGTAILDWAQAGRLGLSKFVSLGNKADVDEADLMLAWQDDPSVRVIMIYTEGLPDGQEFIHVARLVSRKKPIVAVKSGVTLAGSRAVSSHTGSLAGSEQAYQAAFQQAGVLRANSMQDLFDQALAFAYLPELRSDRIAIVTNAGGPGILATDALSRADLSLARFDSARIQALEAYLPDAASAANPVDVLGDAGADRYRFAMEQVVADPHVDGVLVILTPQATTQIPETAQVVAEIASQASIPILACFMGEARVQEGVEILDAHKVPSFPHPERAALALKALSTYRNYRQRPLPEFETLTADHDFVRAKFDQVLSEGRVSIGDPETRGILSAYGFQIPPSQLAETSDQAVAMADEIGYPVVMKIASPDILHKTDVGGVKVNLENAEDVRDAFDLITYRAQRYLPDARLRGCLVQKMVAPGLEVLIGMNRDPQFGPLVTFGLGGIYVEILKDVAFRLAPFSRREAAAMLEEIRARALLDGFRGQQPVDKSAIIDALLRIAQLVIDFPEIAELDINPFVVYEKERGGVALDMRMVLTPNEHVHAGEPSHDHAGSVR
jgi:acetyl coenzyme A synthetase (ADP forming)-like protein